MKCNPWGGGKGGRKGGGGETQNNRESERVSERKHVSHGEGARGDTILTYDMTRESIPSLASTLP